MQTLFHAFSLQLPCRRVLYVELIKLLRAPLLPNRCRDLDRDEIGHTDDDRIGGEVDATEICPEAQASIPLLSPQLLSMISQKVNSRLCTFLKPLESSPRSADAESRSRFSGLDNYNTQQSVNSSDSASKTLSTQHCIETFFTLKGQEFALGEDFSLLIALSHVLSTAMCEADTASDMLSVSKVIIGTVLPNVRGINRSEGSWSLQFTASDVGIEGPGSGRVQESLNSEDLGPTGSFLLALVNFIADGFPIHRTTQRDGNASVVEKDSGLDSRISSSSSASSKRLPNRNLEMDVPLYSTLSLSARKENPEEKENTVNGKINLTEKQRKEEERQIKIVHFALCYSLLTGLLSTLTLTLLSSKEASRVSELLSSSSVEEASRRCEFRVNHCTLLFDVYDAVYCSCVSFTKSCPHSPNTAVLDVLPSPVIVGYLKLILYYIHSLYLLLMCHPLYFIYLVPTLFFTFILFTLSLSLFLFPSFMSSCSARYISRTGTLGPYIRDLHGSILRSSRDS
jgi:hypothetical protein